jgi:hypothetical protein
MPPKKCNKNRLTPGCQRTLKKQLAMGLLLKVNCGSFYKHFFQKKLLKTVVPFTGNELQKQCLAILTGSEKP